MFFFRGLTGMITTQDGCERGTALVALSSGWAFQGSSKEAKGALPMHARSKPNYVQILLSPRDGPPNGFCVREEWSYLVYDFFRRPFRLSLSRSSPFMSHAVDAVNFISAL
jgi:hypothetical protein